MVTVEEVHIAFFVYKCCKKVLEGSLNSECLPRFFLSVSRKGPFWPNDLENFFAPNRGEKCETLTSSKGFTKLPGLSTRFSKSFTRTNVRLHAGLMPTFLM